MKTASEMTYTVSGGALNSTQTKPNQNKHGMNDVVPQGGIITATDHMLKIFIFFPAFANEMSVCVCVRAQRRHCPISLPPIFSSVIAR